MGGGIAIAAWNMLRSFASFILPRSEIRVLWFQVLALAGVQGAITLCWLVYKLYLPKLLGQFGFPVTLAATLLIIENLLAAVMEPVMGGLSDKSQRWMGTKFPFISVGVVLSSALFIGIPAIVIFGNSGAVFRIVLLIAIIAWALAMTVFRSPVLSLLYRYATPPALPLAASILTLVTGLITSLYPLTSKTLLKWEPGITFAIGSFILLLAATILRTIHPPEVPENREVEKKDNLISHSPLPTLHSLLPNLGLIFITGMGINWGTSFFMSTIQKTLTNQIGAAKVPSVMLIIGISLAFAALAAGAIAIKLGNSRTMLLGIGVIIPSIVIISSTTGTIVTLIGIVAIASFSLIINGTLPFAFSLMPPQRGGLGIGMYFGGLTAGVGLFGLIFPTLNTMIPITTGILGAIAFFVAGSCIAASQILPLSQNN